MNYQAIQAYAEKQQIPFNEARQVFVQILILKYVSNPLARFMGGTALVLGYGNPRFSEDVDFTQVRDVQSLGPGLKRTAAEVEKWLNIDVSIIFPKPNRMTWRLQGTISAAESFSVHVDSQPFKAHIMRPIVIEFPSIPSFVCEALSLNEIMAEKILALAFRNYLGGRDLFDLWFHWLRNDSWRESIDEILDLVRRKLKERKKNQILLEQHLKKKLVISPALDRACNEWERYLPHRFQKQSVYDDILERTRFLANGDLWQAK